MRVNIIYPKRHNSFRQSGNVLFLILIAVALFAALAYAVTTSNRGGSGSISNEKLELEVTSMLQYFSLVRTAVFRLIATGQCTEKTIRFWHASRINAANPTHYGDGSSPECQIFNPMGGDVPYKERPEALLSFGQDEIMVVSDNIFLIGQDGNTAGSDGQGIASDLIIMVNVPLEACLLANEKLGITNPSGAPPAFSVSASTLWTSPGTAANTFPSSTTGGYVIASAPIGGGASRAPQVSGFSSGCFTRNHPLGSPYYVLYTVLLER